jgi:ribulose-phosphate 3-epimerase
MIDGTGRPIQLEIDGGIAPDTVALATEAGARVLVAGNAVFRDPAGYAAAITRLRTEGSRGLVAGR